MLVGVGFIWVTCSQVESLVLGYSFIVVVVKECIFMVDIVIIAIILCIAGFGIGYNISRKKKNKKLGLTGCAGCTGCSGVNRTCSQVNRMDTEQ